MGSDSKNTAVDKLLKKVRTREGALLTKEVVPGVRRKEPPDPRIDRTLWEFGMTVRSRREQLGLSIKKLAALVGVGNSVIYRLEHGYGGGLNGNKARARVVSKATLIKMLDALYLPRELADRVEFIWNMNSAKGTVKDELVRLATLEETYRREIIENRDAGRNRLGASEARENFQGNSFEEIPVMEYDENSGNLKMTDEFVRVPGLKGESLRAFKIISDDMYPTAPQNSFVVFDLNQSPGNRELGLFVTDEGVLLRQYHTYSFIELKQYFMERFAHLLADPCNISTFANLDLEELKKQPLKDIFAQAGADLKIPEAFHRYDGDENALALVELRKFMLNTSPKRYSPEEAAFELDTLGKVVYVLSPL